MIVVDTNIISYLFISGDFSTQAEKIFLKDSKWAAPLLWRSEFRSVLAQYIRKGLLTLEDAIEIMESAATLMENNEFDVSSGQVLELVNASNLSAYDCEFVALAKNLGVKLVTVDLKISVRFPDCSLAIQDYIGTNKNH
jgi:predicted nucleic acid-binding protein